jgi:hypothetical protein
MKPSPALSPRLLEQKLLHQPVVERVAFMVAAHHDVVFGGVGMQPLADDVDDTEKWRRLSVAIFSMSLRRTTPTGVAVRASLVRVFDTGRADCMVRQR